MANVCQVRVRGQVNLPTVTVSFRAILFHHRHHHYCNRYHHQSHHRRRHKHYLHPHYQCHRKRYQYQCHRKRYQYQCHRRHQYCHRHRQLNQVKSLEHHEFFHQCDHLHLCRHSLLLCICLFTFTCI